MICTMAVKVIMVFECNFIYEFGNLIRNFPIPIEPSIERSTVPNTTTLPVYDFLGPNPRTFFPNKQQMIVQYECKYTILNGSMWKLMICNFFCGFCSFMSIVNFKDFLRIYRARIVIVVYSVNSVNRG